MRILIADDDRVTTTLLFSRLRAAGHECTVAADAMQAVMMAMRGKPEVILLDINMPGGSGIHVLERMKASGITANVFVIVISANVDRAVAEKVRALGINEFMTKPIDFDFLLACLAKLGAPAAPVIQSLTLPK
jgi:DNA-binding response OmpR family regulator